MRVERITSRHNPLVGRFRDAAAGGPDAPLLLDGAHLVSTALDSGWSLETVAIGKRVASSEDDAVQRMRTQLANRRVPVVEVAQSVLDAISPVRAPSGIVALAARREVRPPQLVEPAPALVLVLVQVQDPGNVGAVVRAADAAGATGVITTDGCADPFGWKALRGSMGSALRVPIWARAPLPQVERFLHEQPLFVLATDTRAEQCFDAVDLRTPVALLLGAEGQGLPAEVLAWASTSVKVPMRDGVDSLNVAVTAALLAYEARRQRRARF